MNLTDLRNRVKAITDYSPELTVYNEQIDLFLNSAYMSLWTEKRWKFAEKTIFMDIYPDINSTQLTPSYGTIDAFVTNNSRQVLFSNLVPQLLQRTFWEGQIIQIEGVDYGIQSVIQANNITLDRPYRNLNGGTTLGDEVTTSDWKIKHRFYDLPQDAIELLYLGHRDTPVVGKQPPYGAVRGLLQRRDEDINLKEDYTSFYSECYVPYPPVNVPPAETQTLTASNTANGALTNGYYELCWCFEYGEDRLGPLSAPSIVQLTGLNDTITIAFLSWDGQPATAPAMDRFRDQEIRPYEGLRKRVWYNQNFNRTTGQRLSGLPVWREVTFGDSAATSGSIPKFSTELDPIRGADTTASMTISYPNQMSPGNRRYMDYDGVAFRIRPYPRPIGYDFKYEEVAGEAAPQASNTAVERGFRQWECRYYRKPHPMGLQTDAPELPAEFHVLVVYKALYEIFMKHDNLSQAEYYRKKYEKDLERLEDRYVDSVDLDIVRQQFGGNYRIWTPFDPNSLRRIS
jgi:hypothetical protein